MKHLANRCLRGPFRHPLRLTPLVALICLVGSSASAAAQIRAAHLTSHNDAYLFWIPADRRPDYEYSNGLRAAITVDGSPGWTALARALGAAGGTGSASPQTGAFTTMELGHSIYTPRFDSSVPMPGQRPFAGWLFGRVTGLVVSGSVRQSVGLAVGVTGPPSLAEPVAKRIHTALGVYAPMGWSHQLETEPGVILSYGIEREVGALYAGRGRLADVAVEGGARLGNVRAGIQAGASGRLGINLPVLFEPARRGPAIYALGGVRGELVGRDLFLDGNTFRPDGRVSRVPFVATAHGGVGLGLHGMSVEYRLTSRTRSYREEPGGHTIGTIELAWRPDRQSPPASIASGAPSPAHR